MVKVLSITLMMILCTHVFCQRINLSAHFGTSILSETEYNFDENQSFIYQYPYFVSNHPIYGNSFNQVTQVQFSIVDENSWNPRFGAGLDYKSKNRFGSSVRISFLSSRYKIYYLAQNIVDFDSDINNGFLFGNDLLGDDEVAVTKWNGELNVSLSYKFLRLGAVDVSLMGGYTNRFALTSYYASETKRNGFTENDENLELFLNTTAIQEEIYDVFRADNLNHF